MKELNQSGFIAPVITPDHYVLGDLRIGAVEEVLEADQDWGKWDFINDIQSKKFETYNCTGFNTAQSISKILYRKYGVQFKPSPRWIGIIAGTNPGQGGNDPHHVCEAIRQYGLIPDEMLPFSDDLQSVEEYYSFKGADEKACYEEGRNWLAQYEFKHDWVSTSSNTLSETLNNMKVALKFSPLGSAVYAWAINGQGLYERLDRDNHWTEVRAFKGDDAIVDDSYEPFEKELTPDFKFIFVKRYIINKKDPVVENQKAYTFLGEILKFLKDLLFLDLKFLQTMPKPMENTPISPIETPKNDLGTLVKSYVGKDASPNGKAPQSLACAEGVSNILHEYDSSFPAGILSTQDLFKVLLSNKELCTPILDPLPGCVIISPTIGAEVGHTGFLIENQRIISNDSSSGLMQNNYSFNNWVDYFKGKKKLRVFIFQIL